MLFYDMLCYSMLCFMFSISRYESFQAEPKATVVIDHTGPALIGEYHRVVFTVHANGNSVMQCSMRLTVADAAAAVLADNGEALEVMTLYTLHTLQTLPFPLTLLTLSFLQVPPPFGVAASSYALHTRRHYTLAKLITLLETPMKYL
jgi:hypothetical protein